MRKKIVFLFLVLCNMVSGQFEVSYKEMEYEHRIYSYQSLLFEAIFDEEAFINYDDSSCSTSTKPNPLKVISCCSTSGQTGCFSPPTNVTCINSALTDSLVINPYTGVATKSYQFQFSNVQTAMGFISIVPNQGVVYLNVWGSSPTQNFIQITSSPAQRSVAFCSTLFVVGSKVTITIDVIAMLFVPTESTVGFSLYIDTLPTNLPLKRYFPFANIAMNIDVYQLTCSPNVNSSFCNFDFILTENDTFYNTMSRVGKTTTFTEVQNKITWEFIATITNTETQAIQESFDWDILADGTAVISVQFNNFVDDTGATITQIQTAQLANDSCVYDLDVLNASVTEFNTAHAALDDPFSPGLNNFAISSINIFDLVTDWRVYLVTAPTIKDSWRGCVNLIEDTLLYESIGSVYNVTSSGCQSQKGSNQYAADPCCNYTLQATQCCPIKVFSQTLYVPQPKQQSELSAPYCSVYGLDCATSHLQAYANDMKASATCATELLDDNPTTVSDIFDNCYNPLVSSYCTSDAYCHQLFGNNTFCAARSDRGYYIWGRFRGNFPERVCRWLCSTDNDCYYGSCINMGSWGECHYSDSVDPYLQPNIAIQLSNCIATLALSSGPYFQRNFLATMNLTIADATLTEVATNILTLTASITDCNLSFFPQFQANFVSDYCSNGKQTCNWHSVPYNSTYSIIKQYSPSLCTNPFYKRTPINNMYCALTPFEHKVVYPEVSQMGDCLQMTSQDVYGFEEDAGANSCPGSWDPFAFGCSLGTGTTQNSCLNPTYCPPSALIPINNIFGLSPKDMPPRLINGTACLPRCIWVGALQSDCTDATRMAWWNDGNACELAATTLEICQAYTLPKGKPFWWMGAYYYPPQYNTNNLCSSFCLSNPLITNAGDCNQGSHCTNPLCNQCDFGQCIASGYCDALPGCYFKLDSSMACDLDNINNVFLNYDEVNEDLNDMIYWTPGGCVVVFPGGFAPITPFTCTLNNGVYRSYNDWATMTASTCTQSTVCRLQNVDIMDQINQRMASDPTYIPQHNPPPDITFVSAADCTACGGVVMPTYNWNTGSQLWVGNSEQWIQLNWQQRAMKAFPVSPTLVIQKEDFMNVFNLVDIRGEIDYVNKRITCYFTEQMGEVPTIACLCQGRNDTNVASCNCEIDTSINTLVGSFTLCSGLPITLQRSFGTIVITSAFTLPDPTSCMDALVQQTVLNQVISDPELKTYDIGRGFNTQLGREYYQYIKNSHHIIVGQIIGDGFSFSYTKPVPNMQGVSVCLYISFDPSLVDSRFNFPLRDFGQATISTNGTFGPIVLLHASINESADGTKSACIPNPVPGFIYIPVALATDQNAIYVSTMSPADIASLIAGIVFYVVASIAIGFVLFIDMRSKGLKFTTFIKPLAFFAIPAFILRIAYAGWLMNDPTDDFVSILFIECPSQLLWSLSSLMLVRWIRPPKPEEDEDCCCSCKRCLVKIKIFLQVIVVLNGGLFIAYMVYMFAPNIHHTLLPESPVYAEQQTMSYIWFMYFMTFCCIGLIWFGLLVCCGMCNMCMPGFNTEEELIKRAVLVSVIATMIMYFGQNFVLIRTFLWQPTPFDAYIGWPLREWYWLLLVVDLVPVVPLLYAALLSPMHSVRDLFGTKESY